MTCTLKLCAPPPPPVAFHRGDSGVLDIRHRCNGLHWMAIAERSDEEVDSQILPTLILSLSFVLWSVPLVPHLWKCYTCVSSLLRIFSYMFDDETAVVCCCLSRGPCAFPLLTVFLPLRTPTTHSPCP